MNLKENLIKFRTARGETQSQLAEVLGVSNRTVSKWECGDGEPDVSMLMKLAEHYEISLDELCGIITERKRTENSVEDVVAETFRKMYNTMYEMRDSLDFNDVEKVKTAVMTDPPHALGYYSTLSGDVTATGVYVGGVWSHVVNASDNNLIVSLFRNSENFAWLRDRADELTNVFAWLTDTDILKFLYLTLSNALPNGYTAEYVEETFGIPVEKVRGFLDFSRSLSHEAELLDGTVTVYEQIDSIFSGMWLAVLSLGYEFLQKDHVCLGYLKSSYYPIVPENEV